MKTIIINLISLAIVTMFVVIPPAPLHSENNMTKVYLLRGGALIFGGLPIYLFFENRVFSEIDSSINSGLETTDFSIKQLSLLQ